MSNTDPQRITATEWREIVAVPEVRDAWGITDEETPDDIAALVYGVRFDFQSGGPGYQGDLFILHGDAEDSGPLVLRRDASGKLMVASM